MVTKRAQRWVRRGVTATIVLVVMILAAATWFTSEAIETDLLLVTGAASTADPGDAGWIFTQVDVPGPLGNYPAWLVPPLAESADDTWAILVHDDDAGRDQALDLLSAFFDAGIGSMVISYRDDAVAPPSGGGHRALGADEWEDLEAAVVFATEAGARDLVLVGYGSGGAMVLTFLRRSVHAEQVVGVIVDSAYLDPGAMVDDRTAADKVPGFLSGWGKALATFRFGVDWAMLDQVAAAGEFSTPILLIHGDRDDTVPIRLADAFAAALPDLVEYLRIEGAAHLG
ncbi:MAG: hypothetical protein ABIJ75_09940, partial [Actinomycetota bacterium]